MKKIYFTLFVVCYICAHATGQTISVSSQILSLTDPGPSVLDTISATGLIPASGKIVVEAPNKFYVKSGGTWDFSDTIAYSGGILPPTAIEIKLGFSGATGNYVTISGGGAYAQICVKGNNPGYQCIQLSVDEVSDQPSIVVSPNPAADNLTVTSTKNINSITIKNLVGSTVYTQQYNTKELKMDIATLPNGMYLLWINDTEVRKFIKN